jgi:hypothetical protein
LVWLVLDLDNGTSTLTNDLFGQIDACLCINGTGNPQNVYAANRPGVRYIDLTTGDLYYCTATDTTIDGTTWASLITAIGNATTSQAGILELAGPSDVTARTNNTKAMTPYDCAGFALNGVNGDITELVGLNIPLTLEQGGTGVDSLTNLIAEILPSFVQNALLTNSGGVLEWTNIPSPLNLMAATGVAIINCFNFLTAEITVSIPAAPTAGSTVSFGFASAALNSTIQSAGSDLILGTNDSITVDNTANPFTLVYTGATFGWVLRK